MSVASHFKWGIAPKKPLYKECKKMPCMRRTLSVSDDHQLCINCLGPLTIAWSIVMLAVTHFLIRVLVERAKKADMVEV